MERAMAGDCRQPDGLKVASGQRPANQVDILILKRIKYSDICSPVCEPDRLFSFNLRT
jgi:hypothetical protein